MYFNFSNLLEENRIVGRFHTFTGQERPWGE